MDTLLIEEYAIEQMRENALICNSCGKIQDEMEEEEFFQYPGENGHTCSSCWSDRF